MSRSASDVFYPEIAAARADGDTIVACPDLGVEDGDTGGGADMYAVSVGAGPGGRHLHALHLHVLATVDDDVEDLAVEGAESAHQNVLGVAD